MKKLLLTLLVAILAMPAFAQDATISFVSDDFDNRFPDSQTGQWPTADNSVTSSKYKDGVYLSGFFNRAVDDLSGYTYMSAGMKDASATAYLTIAQYNVTEAAAVKMPVETFKFAIEKLVNNLRLYDVTLAVYKPTAGDGNLADKGTLIKSVSVKSSFTQGDANNIVINAASLLGTEAKEGMYIYQFAFTFKSFGSTTTPLLAIKSLDIVNSVKKENTIDLVWDDKYQSEFTRFVGEEFIAPQIDDIQASALSDEEYDALIETLKYRSTNPLAATVDDNGTVVLKSQGTTDIYAYVTYKGVEYKSTSYKLKVFVNTATLTWDNNQKTVPYTKRTYIVGTDFDAPEVAPDADIVYSLQSGPAGVTVSSTGVVLLPTTFKPAADGTNIVIQAKAGSNYTSDPVFFTLTVVPAISWEAGTNASYNMPFGTEFTMPGIEYYDNDNKPAVTYSSSNIGVATIDKKTGVITAEAVGRTTITATDEFTSLTFVLNVQKGTPTLSYAESVITVKQEEVSSFVSPDVTKTNAAGATVTYSTSNSAVATVGTDGKVSLTGTAGTAVITATIAGDDKFNAATASYTINVVKDLAEGTIDMTYANTNINTTTKKANLPLFGLTQTIPADVEGLSRENGKFVASASGATISFATANVDFSYMTLTIPGVSSFSVRTSPVAKGSPAYTQNKTEENGSVTIIPQPETYYRITIPANAEFTDLTFVPSEPITLDNADVYEILATEKVSTDWGEKDKLVQQEVTDGEVSGYSSLYEDGQLVRLRFLASELDGATVYYAFIKGGNLVNLTTQTWAEAFKQQVNGKNEPIVDENGDPVCSVVVDSSINKEDYKANASTQGSFKAYEPGTFLLLNDATRNGKFYYFTEKNGVMSHTLSLDVDATVTGIEDIVADEAAGEAVYYNLQGVKIANPTPGQVYVRVIGKKADKVVFK